MARSIQKRRLRYLLVGLVYWSNITLIINMRVATVGIINHSIVMRSMLFRVTRQ